MVLKTGNLPLRNGRRQEIGAIHKSWRDRISVALVFPNTYSVGITNLGFQAVYRLLNDMDTVVCERAFLPDPGRQKFGKKGPGRKNSNRRILDKGTPIRKGFDHSLCTEESGRQLSEFDIIAFSVSFENDYLNILAIIDMAGIPLRSKQRNTHPLVIAGGVACWLNPEPLAPFIDLFLIGEAEVLLSPFIQAYKKDTPRADFLKMATRKIPGVYVPGFYQPAYHPDGTLRAFHPTIDGVPLRVKRMIVPDLAGVNTYTTVVSSQTAFDSAFLVEVGRGCARGCRFCSAGFIYRPPRFRDIASLVACLETGKTVADRIGLVGAAVSDLPGLELLCRHASEMKIPLAFSSLRADSLTESFVQALVDSGVRTATIAPDAGSERMRRVINKGLTEKDILTSTETLVAAGIANLKLYFMVGLPTETEADVAAIVTLTASIKEIFLRESRRLGRMGNITVSLNCFVPKPFTPFQWVAMDDISHLKKKIMTVRKGLGRLANVVFRSESPRKSFIQALLARGDRRVSYILASAHQYRGNWSRALADASIDPAFFVCRRRDVNERLPWDFIDGGVSNVFLQRESEKALRESPSKPCPLIHCTRCGACLPVENT